MSMIQAPQAQQQTWDYTAVVRMSTKAPMLPFSSKLYTRSHISTATRGRLTSYLTSTEDGKTEPEEAYSADTTQQPIHIKASPSQAEHAVVCH